MMMMMMMTIMSMTIIIFFFEKRVIKSHKSTRARNRTRACVIHRSQKIECVHAQSVRAQTPCMCVHASVHEDMRNRRIECYPTCEDTNKTISGIWPTEGEKLGHEFEDGFRALQNEISRITM